MTITSNVVFTVSPQGNDAWSGRLAEPDAQGTDGPFATITRARDTIRALKLTGRLSGPAIVQMRSGRYQITRPVVFGPEDSGPITYAAYPGERPVLDGGQRIKGWREEEVGSNEMWVADLPQVAAGDWYFHQLFVNGERRNRPRLPKAGLYWMEDVPGTSLTASIFDGTDTFRCAPGDVKTWKNPTDIDIVVLHWWIEDRMPIATFDEQTRLVTSSRRSMMALRDDFGHHYGRYYVDNVREALSEPGEWYLDRPAGRLYYIPLPGESPETAEVVAPRVEQLLKLVGKTDEGRYLEFLRFEGLTFEHSDWSQPTALLARFQEAVADVPEAPGAVYAGSAQAACDVPGAIYLEGARFCAIENCRIAHVGDYGIDMAEGCLANRITGNEITDLGAGGIKMSGCGTEGPLSGRTGDNWITDNHVHSGGRVFPSAAGIFSGHAFGNTISHNHIHDFYYTGISCGWVWGFGDNVSMNNRIEKNHIHDLGHGLLSDMGGIYMLGVQPGTALRGNLIHDVERYAYGGWGIYLDEGSAYMVVEGNICYNLSSQGFHHHIGRENLIRNNIFAFGREAQVILSRFDEHNAVTFERNIVITDGQPLFTGRPGLLEKGPFLSDLNLFWDVAGRPLVFGTGRHNDDGTWLLQQQYTFDQWRELGNDQHSTIADPRCRDVSSFDFTLASDSPALQLGFQPVDMSDVGPRSA